MKRYNDFCSGGNVEITETNHPKKTHSLLILLIAEIIAIAVFALGVHLFAKRDATNNDVEINYTANFATIGVECNIVPRDDIDDLDLKFNFYNNNKTKIYEITKSVGKTKKDNSYSISISLFEIKCDQIPYSCTVEIVGGTIQLLF